MIQTEARLTNPQGPLEKGARLGISALIAEDFCQGVERSPNVWVRWSENTLPNRYGLLQPPVRFNPVTQTGVVQGEIVQDGCRV